MLASMWAKPAWISAIHEKDLHWQEDNTVEGIKRILKRLAHYQVERLVMEATGRYEFELAQAAYDKGLPVCIAKPLSVRRYAGAVEQLAKTDKIDAAIIAEYAAVVKPRAPRRRAKTSLPSRTWWYAAGSWLTCAHRR